MFSVTTILSVENEVHCKIIASSLLKFSSISQQTARSNMLSCII
jgi:hypothetical protein